jgi:hypothetical protein
LRALQKDLAAYCRKHFVIQGVAEIDVPDGQIFRIRVQLPGEKRFRFRFSENEAT